MPLKRGIFHYDFFLDSFFDSLSQRSLHSSAVLDFLQFSLQAFLSFLQYSLQTFSDRWHLSLWQPLAKCPQEAKPRRAVRVSREKYFISNSFDTLYNDYLICIVT